VFQETHQKFLVRLLEKTSGSKLDICGQKDYKRAI